MRPSLNTHFIAMESRKFWHALSTTYRYDKTGNLIIIMKMILRMFMIISNGNGNDNNNNNYSCCSYYKKITCAVVRPTPRSMAFIF